MRRLVELSANEWVSLGLVGPAEPNRNAAGNQLYLGPISFF